MVLHARVVLDLCEQLEQEISFDQVEGDFDSFRGGRRIGFCKRLRVDGGEDAEIMREECGYGWVLQGRRRSLAAIGEEEKTLAEKTTLAGFSKKDNVRWVLQGRRRSLTLTHVSKLDRGHGGDTNFGTADLLPYPLGSKVLKDAGDKALRPEANVLHWR
ncbi:unnamed protein product [Prunus armeniaca]